MPFSRRNLAPKEHRILGALFSPMSSLLVRSSRCGVSSFSLVAAPRWSALGTSQSCPYLDGSPATVHPRPVDDSTVLLWCVTCCYQLLKDCRSVGKFNPCRRRHHCHSKSSIQTICKCRVQCVCVMQMQGAMRMLRVLRKICDTFCKIDALQRMLINGTSAD